MEVEGRGAPCTAPPETVIRLPVVGALMRTSGVATLLLVAALLLAGCAAQPIVRPSPTTDPRPQYAFADPVIPLDRPDGFGSEPSLLATPDGTLYFTSVLGSATARGDGLWKSTDQGATWTYLGKADYPFGGGDSDLDILEGGRLLLTGQWRPAAPPSLPVLGSPYITGGESVFHSDDGGATWTPNPVAGYLPAADRNWLATYGRDVAYLVFNDLATGLMVGKSVDGGLTWLPPVTVQGTGQQSGTLAGPNGIAGDPITSPDGTLYIPYGSAIGGGTSQRLYRSTDGGQTFTEHTVRRTPPGERAGGIFPTVAIDGEGTLHYVWAETHDEGLRTLYSRSADQGDTWTHALQVTPSTVTSVFPWVVAGDRGRIAIGYYATSGSHFPDDAPQNATWVPVVSFADQVGEGNPHFAHVGVTDKPNHVGPICTQGTGCAGGRLLGDFFEMAVLPDGRVAIAYVDDTGEDRLNMVAVQGSGPRLLGDPDA